MAWPLTPLTTYVSSTTPAIKAADLNAFQSAINSLYSGTLTLKSLNVDGTGANASALGAGNILASGTMVSQTATAKELWIPGLNFVAVSGGAASYGGTGGAQPVAFGASGTPAIYAASLCLPFQEPGANSRCIITGVELWGEISNTATMTLKIWQVDPTNILSGGSTLVTSASVTNSSGGAAIEFVNISGLTLSSGFGTTRYCWLTAEVANNSESIKGAVVSYTAPVF